MATRKPKPINSWPLGEYLRDQRGRMSIREAARRADISESRWRQIEAGVQKMAGGLEVPVHPRPETLAAMCRAITADTRQALELAGHNPDQYGWLLVAPVENLSPSDRTEWFANLPRQEREEVLAELQRAHVDAAVSDAASSKRGRSVAG